MVKSAQATTNNDINIVVTLHLLGINSLASGDDEHSGEIVTCRAWHDAGVNIILSGHVRRQFLLDAREQLIINPDRCDPPMWILNAGTAISRRVRHGHPNSFNLLKCGENEASNRMSVGRWDYGLKVNEFVRHHSLDVDLEESVPVHGK